MVERKNKSCQHIRGHHIEHKMLEVMWILDRPSIMPRSTTRYCSWKTFGQKLDLCDFSLSPALTFMLRLTTWPAFERKRHLQSGSRPGRGHRRIWWRRHKRVNWPHPHGQWSSTSHRTWFFEQSASTMPSADTAMDGDWWFGERTTKAKLQRKGVRLF